VREFVFFFLNKRKFRYFFSFIEKMPAKKNTTLWNGQHYSSSVPKTPPAFLKSGALAHYLDSRIAKKKWLDIAVNPTRLCHHLVENWPEFATLSKPKAPPKQKTSAAGDDDAKANNDDTNQQDSSSTTQRIPEENTLSKKHKTNLKRHFSTVKELLTQALSEKAIKKSTAQQLGKAIEEIEERIFSSPAKNTSSSVQEEEQQDSNSPREEEQQENSSQEDDNL
jgi:hypothetical protein